MTRIFLDLDTNGIGHHILDGWYSYRQSMIPGLANPQIDFVQSTDADIRIKISYLPDEIIDSKEYDMIMICNGGEPYFVSSPLIKELLKDPKIYMISNAYHRPDIHLGYKNIWYPHHIPTFQMYCTDGRYPQYYEFFNKFSSLKRSPRMISINGQNRTWRYHFFKKISNRQLGIQCHNALGDLPTKTLDSQWESDEDIVFRDLVNDLYPTVDGEDMYYSKSVIAGINQKLGSIPPGYFLLPYYFENSCVIFPETDWQNDFLVITEKSLKCFYAGCLPFPIGGANVNSLYNELGFFTAWNLLPNDLQGFDSERNHDIRYDMVIDALDWMDKNSQIWTSDQFHDMTRANKETFFSCSSIHKSVSMFDQTFTKILKL